MATLNQNKDVRIIQAGIKVSKAAVALPLNTTLNLFSVTGGRVLLNLLAGNVAVALGGTAQTVTLGVINTGSPGGTSATCLGTAGSVTSLGALSQIVANPGGAVIVSPLRPDTTQQAGIGGSVNTVKNPYLLPVSTVYVTTNASNGTGTVSWDLVYTPLDDGAQVTSL